MVRTKRVTDEELLEAARAVFIEQGPGASTTEIAKRVGLSQAALFKRYGTKEELMFRALLPSRPLPWEKLLEEDLAERPIRGQLRNVLTHMLRSFKEMVPRMMVLKSAGLNPETILRRDPNPVPLAAMRGFTMWIAEGQEQGRIRADLDPMHAAMALIGGMHSRAFFTHILGQHFPNDDDAYIESLLQLYWDGLNPTTERSAS